MSDAEPVKDRTAHTLRMPEALLQAVRREAAHNNRSLNAELVTRLEESLHLRQAPSRVLPAAMLKAELPAPTYGGATQQELALLALYRALPPDKQRALLTVLG